MVYFVREMLWFTGVFRGLLQFGVDAFVIGRVVATLVFRRYGSDLGGSLLRIFFGVEVW